ncbi:MAG TPA: hypothetical protein VGW74_07930 [Propionibacteriaceae bacterium]|nr:hypothetical protein [Propionibacteriaceae bacterium]
MTDRFSSGATKLGYNRAGQALFVLIPALAGAGLGWALTAVLDWLLSLSWIPFRGPLNLIDSVPDQIALPVLIGLGLVAGIVFGLYALHEELSITVDNERVRLQRGNADRRLDRTDIADVFLDGKDLVILGHDSNELAREKTDRPAARLAEVFSHYGYRWRAEGDPRAGDFRLWSESAQGLPAGARPMLSMRARALKEKKAADAADLRAELINLGVVVRDEGGKQYWRLAGRPTDSLEA